MGICDRFKANLFQHVYVICLSLVIIIHFLFVTLLDFLRDEDNKDVSYVSSSEYVAMASLIVLLWSLILYQCKVLHKYIFITDIKPIFCLYLSKILAFADIYMLIFKIHPTQFDHPNGILVPSANYRDIGIILLNYSASIQTLTGISSVAPRKVVSELFSATQVILFGIGYGVFILSIAILRFAQTDITANNPTGSIFNATLPSPNDSSSADAQKQQKQSIGLLSDMNASINSVNRDMVPLTSVNAVSNPHSRANGDASSLPATVLSKFVRNYAKYARFFYRYMFLLLVGLQIPRLIIMYFVCDLNCRNNAVLTIGIVLDSALLLITIVSGIIRIRLIRTLGIDVNVSLSGIMRSYITVLVQFGILYFDVWVWTMNGSKPAFVVKTYDADVHNFWQMVVHFLYFSTSTFTNVGTETAVETDHSLGQTLNMIQMVMAVIFHTVVFGVSILDINSYRIKDTQKFMETHTLTSMQSQILKETNRLRDVGLIQRQIRQMVVAQQHVAQNNADNQYVQPVINDKDKMIGDDLN